MNFLLGVVEWLFLKMFFSIRIFLIVSEDRCTSFWCRDGLKECWGCMLLNFCF